MADPNWTLEWIKIAQGLLATLVGGGLVLLGGWLADRRKNAKDDDLREQRETALFTGMFAVRNFIMGRLNEWSDDKDVARLEPLRTAQAYVHRLIDRAPGESQSLIIAVIEIGLSIDVLVATLDRKPTVPYVPDVLRNSELDRQVMALIVAIEQFDMMSSSQLTIMSDEEMMQFPGYAEAMADEPRDDDARR